MKNFNLKKNLETFDFLKEEKNANELNLSVKEGKNEITHSFTLPKKEKKDIIIIGVGSAGYQNIKSAQLRNLKSVDFAICDTHFEDDCNINTFQLGEYFSKGVIQDEDKIRYFLEYNNPRMLILTAGMGGNTSSVAMPLIAKIAKEMDILTLAFVSEPLKFEGEKRQQQAQKGIEALKEVADCCFINTSFEKEENSNDSVSWVFKKSNIDFADNVEQITKIIRKNYTLNIDFSDFIYILKEGKVGIIKTTPFCGEEILNVSINRVLNEITSSKEFNSSELSRKRGLVIFSCNKITFPIMESLKLILDKIDNELNMEIIFGVDEDNSLPDEISITIMVIV